VPRLCGFYPGICLATEEKQGKKLKILAFVISKYIGKQIERGTNMTLP
jgi:hypothetical protein